MKAAFRSTYGQSDVLSIREVEKPTPRDNEVLVRVFAASVNRTDCHVLWGKPFIMRLFTGLFKPRLATTGSDFAGQVEAVGSKVSTFKIGDRVMGFGGVFGIGSHAHYVSFPETEGIVPIPANLSYEQAAACLEGSFYAAAGIGHLDPKPGQKALVYGATGAIGSAYLQYFKHFDVYVTAVCGKENSELVKSLGARKVIDYRTEDFTRDDERYDFVIDAVGKTSFFKCKPIMKEKGIYASSGGDPGNLFAVMISPLLRGKKVLFKPPRAVKPRLMFIKDLVEKGRFKPVIDRTYPLERIGEAFTYVGSGQKIGNVILTMGT